MKNVMIFILISIITVSGLTGEEKLSLKKQNPSWAKSAVWYQIFPERFCNGDKSNDPKPVDMKGAWPYFVPEGWQITPWTSDWYKLQPWETKTGKDFYWNAGTRRYGGDLQGVIDKLDYLKELGINAIFLNPVFESPSLHKYDASMYHHIDNNFGPDPQKDAETWTKEDPSDASTWKWTTADKLFLKLIRECHKRNIKIIIDGVFNHTGTTFWAFQDIVKNQKNSKFLNWYNIKSFDNPGTDKNEFDYEGWFGVKDLPRIRQDENGIVTGPREHILSIVKRWMDPNGDGNPEDGIDGWRLDVAEQVSHNFWKEFRTWVKGLNPDAYIVGEIWWDDWNNYKMMNAAPWLKGDEFDAVMNYRFARAVKDFVISRKEKIGPKEFIDSLNTLYKEYPSESNYVMMNMLDSHDVERISSMVVNPDIRYDHNGSPSSNRNFDVRKPDTAERERQKLIVGLQFTLPGAPQIYYGDESGMWGGDDPDCRKPMVWREFKYETETAHPFGLKRPADKVEFDENLFGWYRKLAYVRNNNKALSLGDITFSFFDESKQMLVYRRSFKGKNVYILTNNSGLSNTLNYKDVKLPADKNSYLDLISGEKIEPAKSGGTISLKPYQIMILK